jgi:deoxycytidine triphosphate deaminase
MITVSVLSDVEIEECIKAGSLVIAPFDASCLGGAGYDLRLSEDTVIFSGQNMLVATLERVELGENLVGTLYLRSTLTRAGVIGSLALVDPGFRGQLTVSLFNAGHEPFKMKGQDRFLQIVFHRLGLKTAHPYAGKYQDSQGVVDSRP